MTIFEFPLVGDFEFTLVGTRLIFEITFVGDFEFPLVGEFQFQLADDFEFPPGPACSKGVYHNTINRINRHPVDSVVCFANTYPPDSDLSGG